MQIRTVIDCLGLKVFKGAKCPVCQETFIMVRNRLSGFYISKIWETEVKSHVEFCALKRNAKKVIAKYYETKN